MDPAALAGEEAVQAVFPAAVAVAGAPVPGSAAVAEERGEARVSTHVVLTAASTVAREATEWLAPEVTSSSAAAAVVAASASAVIRQTLRRGILVATYPAAVHHLRAPTT